MHEPYPRHETRVVVTKHRKLGLHDGDTLPVNRDSTVIFQVLSPLAQAFIRAARTFLQSWLAFLLLELAGRPILTGIGVVMAPGDFVGSLWAAGGLALAPTIIALGQNLIEILTRLDASFPELRA